jgi:hypothetical protein
MAALFTPNTNEPEKYMSSVMTDAFELVKDLAELKDYGETVEDANILYLERIIRERVGRLSRAYRRVVVNRPKPVG